MSEEININPEENEESTETEVEVEAPEVAEKVNPAYERILAELPEAWHAKSCRTYRSRARTSNHS